MLVFYDDTGRVTNVGVATKPIDTTPFGENVVYVAESPFSHNWKDYVYADGVFSYSPVVPTLAQAQSAQLSTLQTAYTQASTAGFTSSADGTARVYPSDAATLSELTQLRLIITAGTFPAAGVQVIDAAGDVLTLTEAQCTTLTADAQSFFLAYRGQLINLSQQVKAATTVSAVQAIVWSNPAY